MNILLVTPGGITRDGRGNVVPALNAFAHAVATQCKLCVVALDKQKHASIEDAGMFSIVRPGRWPGHGLAEIANAKTLMRQLGNLNFQFDVTHSIWLGRPSHLVHVLQKNRTAPWVASVAGQELNAERVQNLSFRRRFIMQRRIENVFKRANLITAGSRQLVDTIACHGRSARWWPLFPDDSLFNPCTIRPRMPEEPLRIITVADHNCSKDILTLLETLRQLKLRGRRVHLDWVGLELEPGRSRKIAESLDVMDCVTIHGHQPHHKIPDFLQNAELYLQSSRFESQGVSVCEAAASGLPIVGTSVGILPEIAPTGAVAVLREDPVALADTIAMLIADPYKLRRLGEGARKWMSEYSISWTVRQALEFYELLLFESARKSR